MTFRVLQGGVQIGATVTSGTVTNGKASVTYVLPGNTPKGFYTISTQYNPGPSFMAASDSSHSLQVAEIRVAINMPDRGILFSPADQTVTLSAAVAPQPGWGTEPVNGGTVTFRLLSLDGTQQFGTAVTSGTVTDGSASVTYAVPGGLAVGSYKVLAVYTPTPSYFNSATTSPFNVLAQAPTTTAVSSLDSTTTYGQATTFTATVSNALGSGGTPTGSVQFKVDGADFGPAVALVNGSATSGSIATLAAGAHTVQAFYTPAGTTFQASDGSLAGGEVVNKAHLTVTANSASRAYGAADPAFAATITGFQNGESLATSGVSGAPALTTSANAASGVGNYSISAAVGTLSATNYTFDFVPGTLQVTPATLTIAPRANQSRVYGAAQPVLTYDASAFVNGDTAALITSQLGTFAWSRSPVGDYPFTLGSLAAGPNYTLVIANNSSRFAITPAALTITPDAGQSKVYGADLPILTYTASGFVNGDTAAQLVGLLGTTATAASPVGMYAFTLGTVSAGGNYTLALAANAPTFAVVSPITPTVSVSDAGGTYTGNPFPASGTAVGADGKTPVAGSLSYVYYSGGSASGIASTTAPTAPAPTRWWPPSPAATSTMATAPLRSPLPSARPPRPSPGPTRPASPTARRSAPGS